MIITSLPIIKQMRDNLQTALNQAIAVGMDAHFVSDIKHLIATTDHNISEIESNINNGGTK